jgi:hypothetical protein
MLDTPVLFLNLRNTNSGPVGKPRGHRGESKILFKKWTKKPPIVTEICQKQFLLQLVMTLMRAGTQLDKRKQ